MEQMTAGRGKPAGFSLVELLAVTAIVVLLAGLAIMAFNSIFAGSLLSRSGNMVADAMLLARQEAVTRNQEMEVRFYRIGGGTGTWRALRVLKILETPNGQTNQAMTRTVLLPDGVVFSALGTLSPLLENGSISGTETLPGYGAATYGGFRFRPGGATDDRINATNNFITLVEDRQKDKNPPPNYYALQINPLTGKISVLQP